MDFSQKKLPAEAVNKLRTCPIESVKAYAPMLSPVYVYMKMNGKFVSVKAPLDFFTPEELERLKPFSTFYLPEFIGLALPFRHAARSLRALLSWPEVDGDPVKLPPSPFELSDATLRILAPLWGKQNTVEPFFVSVFVSELCDPISPEILTKARETSVELYESAIFRSSWAVFLALHLGHCDLGFLGRLRGEVFEGVTHGQDKTATQPTLRELHAAAHRQIGDSSVRVIHGKDFENAADRISQKMASRLKRAQESLMRPDTPDSPSIFGVGGFAS